ncbi:MAG: hypothetical protein JXO72_03805 [Vicinamibacteria bacterium]|nr:hypothetical protein [Vicinamibacteria bacterium]
MRHLRFIFLTVSVPALGLAAAAVRVPPLFITSDRCQACHNGLVTPRGDDVSIGADWRASMMANSARDPYWQASVQRETLFHPKATAAIEHECSACHMPMARYQAKAAGGMGQVFANLPVVPQAGAESAFAVDGVSCAMCHQIGKDRLGERESFVAGFVVDMKTPWGLREIFGPYDVDAGRQWAMNSSSGFLPKKADHIQDSELCATCHTLFTQTLDENGAIAGEFPEQVPYLEWKHSAFNNRMSCGACHMPKLGGKMPISSTLGQPRKEFARHVFRGGNFFMPKVLNRHRDTLGVVAEPLEMETLSARTAAHLERSSARLTVRDAECEDGTLRVLVEVQNLAGHKLPSAYPSRRAWIHFTVTDGSGATVFESGRLNADGSITGNDNDADGTRFEPHYTEIRSEDEVQVYEPILGTTGGKVTTVLLAASRYLKDNRVLPAGFDKATADEDVAVRGRAVEDEDFTGGGDRVRYAVSLEEASGPFTVQAEIWYQPISFRWALNVDDRPSEESERFAAYFREAAGVSGIVLARAEATAQ